VGGSGAMSGGTAGTGNGTAKQKPAKFLIFAG